MKVRMTIDYESEVGVVVCGHSELARAQCFIPAKQKKAVEV